jgi:hypothetical protein
VSETFAGKISGSREVVGKESTIKTRAGKKQTFPIAGVFRDFSDNSHLEAHILLPFARMVPCFRKHAADNRGANNIYFYLSTESPQAALEAVINRNLFNDVRKLRNVSFALQPLSRVHLFSNDIELSPEQDSV